MLTKLSHQLVLVSQFFTWCLFWESLDRLDTREESTSVLGLIVSEIRWKTVRSRTGCISHLRSQLGRTIKVIKSATAWILQLWDKIIAFWGHVGGWRVNTWARVLLWDRNSWHLFESNWSGWVDNCSFWILEFRHSIVSFFIQCRLWLILTRTRSELICCPKLHIHSFWPESIFRTQVTN